MAVFLKVLLILAIVFVCLFVLSMVVYFFNLDMKLVAVIEPVLGKYYDRAKRKRKSKKE